MMMSPVVIKGRSVGVPNFKEAEDVALARAYVQESTVAAIGTDQSGETFWCKVGDAYNAIKPDGSPNRSVSSLTSRFNGTLAKATNKWVGCMTDALRQYHSGWQYADYIQNAHVEYALANKDKRYGHESVYAVLCKIPKFAIDTEQIESRVNAALGLDDVESGDGSEAPVIHSAIRPDVGKKADKKRKLNATVASDGDGLALKELQAVEEAVAATKEKNVLLKESLLIQQESLRVAALNSRIAFFQQCPDSEASKMFFAMQSKLFLAEMEEENRRLADGKVEMHPSDK
ncbi:hypothetical protein DYB36_009601 [Aphanomyces astaci]|uniref:No apical meristem-associated C-terminal domain-containing protein n=1 Tax=Aphanomyces astaci TaxID=112090 RepID=A0A397B994_APHAT|nr:hypothetical protein DYB36_009601 [Aphanomyces astaci]